VDKPITLSEFRRLARGLPVRSGIDLDATVLHVEPLEGRGTLDVRRQCIIEKGGERFVAWWD
jgi:hypothetical protein